MAEVGKSRPGDWAIVDLPSRDSYHQMQGHEHLIYIVI